MPQVFTNGGGRRRVPHEEAAGTPAAGALGYVREGRAEAEPHGNQGMCNLSGGVAHIGKANIETCVRVAIGKQRIKERERADRRGTVSRPQEKNDNGRVTTARWMDATLTHALQMRCEVQSEKRGAGRKREGARIGVRPWVGRRGTEGSGRAKMPNPPCNRSGQGLRRADVRPEDWLQVRTALRLLV